MRTAILVATILLLAACHHGTRVANYDPAQKPQGAEIALKASDQTLEGELLAVQDAGVVILSRDTVVFVPYRTVSRATVDGVGLALQRGKPPRDDMKRRLRLLSRFPQGLEAELLASLLATYGQTQPEVVQ